MRMIVSGRVNMCIMRVKEFAKIEAKKLSEDERGSLPAIQFIQLIILIFIIVLIFRDVVFEFVKNLWEIVIVPILFAKL